jgi:hypothetical protein
MPEVFLCTHSAILIILEVAYLQEKSSPDKYHKKHLPVYGLRRFSNIFLKATYDGDVLRLFVSNRNEHPKWRKQGQDDLPLRTLVFCELSGKDSIGRSDLVFQHLEK